jgi:hypothetical protein
VESVNGVIAGDMHRYATGDVYFRSAKLLNDANEPVQACFYGDQIRMELEFEVCRAVRDMRLIVDVESFDGTIVGVFHSTDETGSLPMDAPVGTYRASVDLDVSLMPGRYTVNLGAKPTPGYWGSGMTWDTVPQAFEFHVEEFSRAGTRPPCMGGVIHAPSRWTVTPVAP